MKRNYLFLALFIILSLTLSLTLSAKLVDLPDLAKPDGIVVDGKEIVINDGTTILIYSQKDVKLLKKFGKKGEGPQEFMASPVPWMPSLRVYLKPNMLFVNSFNKVLIFDRAGNYKLEFKTNSPQNQYIPLEKKYVGMGVPVEDNIQYISYSLYDTTPKKEKDFFRIKSPQQRGKKVNPIVMGTIKNIFHRQAWGDKIFLPSPDGVIHVFDESGKEAATIKPEYEKVNFSAELKKKYDGFFSEDPRFKRIYAQDRGMIEFPEYLPLMKEYRVTAKKVYVITSKKLKEGYLTFVFDHKGKFLKKVAMPLVDMDLLEVYPFTIHNGYLYQLVEASDNENWQLKISEIK